MSKVYYTDKPWAVVVGYIKLNFYKNAWISQIGTDSSDVFHVQCVLSLLSTNLASAYSLSNASRFKGLRKWSLELRVPIDRGQPETEFVGKVVARPTRSIALDEWSGPEVTQARPRARQSLTSSLSTCPRMLK